MRHGKHNNTLVATQEHRKALMSNLAAALFTHGRIQTTLAKAKALRPFAEKVITLAKKAKLGDKIRAIHMKRLALTYVRNEDAVHTLFTEKVEAFMKRPGGYTRIYKLDRRIGDAAEMALIELCGADDEQHLPRSKRAGAKAEKKAPTKKAAAKEEAKAEAVEVKAEEASAEEPKAEKKPAAKKAPAKKKAEPKAEEEKSEDKE